MKVSIDQTTGLMIEAQSHADDATLIGNAGRCGFSAVEIRDVTEAELHQLIALKYPQSCQELRSAEYPPVQDYLDAQVKKSSGDPAINREGVLQEEAYLAACIAVKAKYPKPVVA